MIASSLLILSSLCLAACSAQDVTVAVIRDSSTGEYTWVLGPDASKPAPKGLITAAKAVFDDKLLVTGWGVLNVETTPELSVEDQYYAAGLVEGFATAARTSQHFENMRFEFFKEGSVEDQPTLVEFFKNQLLWTDKKIALNKESSALWKQIGAIQQQFYGLRDGYEYARKQSGIFIDLPELDTLKLQFLQAVGDMLDLQSALNLTKSLDWESMTFQQIEAFVMASGRCSGLIKVAADFSELYAAHSSWFTYMAMNRIYKHYKFYFGTEKFVESFSSYPGVLSSLDDFYIMSTGLTMVQTTNNIFDLSLYSLIKPSSLFAWQRVRLANELARSGQEWFDYVKMHNSGTYNNQYMIVNNNLFTPKHELPDNLLWVVEQIPGLVVGEDRTADLRRGYWPSYNVPYFKEIYARSGYVQVVEKFGESLSYELAPRALLFRQYAANVTDIDSLQAFMRYNNYLNDPLTDHNPMHAICSRGDLQSENSNPGGCYDSKVTSHTLSKSQTSFAVNGPTTSHDLPAFSWSKFAKSSSAHFSHLGQPDKFDFNFIKMSPIQ